MTDLHELAEAVRQQYGENPAILDKLKRLLDAGEEFDAQYTEATKALNPPAANTGD